MEKAALTVAGQLNLLIKSKNCVGFISEIELDK